MKIRIRKRIKSKSKIKSKTENGRVPESIVGDCGYCGRDTDMRITPDTLVNAEPPLTAEQSITAAIRQGIYPWVAAESVGLSGKRSPPG